MTGKVMGMSLMSLEVEKMTLCGESEGTVVGELVEVVRGRGEDLT